MTSAASRMSLLKLANAGVFVANKTKPIHRWYPFIEGYSSDLVLWGLRMSDVEKPKILDPFGGSGTTGLTAAEKNLESWFCEVNPFMAWMADVKINKSKLVTTDSDLTQLKNLAKRAEDGRLSGSKPKNFESILELEKRRSFFPDGVALTIGKTLAWVDDEITGPTRDIARAAIAVSLVPSSAMVRRTDLRRRTARDPLPKKFEEVLASNLRMMIDDLQPNRFIWTKGARQLADDVRTLEPVGRTRFDMIITSPPYLNGTNYCRNTKLELIYLGFIDDERGLSQFRMESITAGINSVSNRRNTPETIAEVEKVARLLDEVAYDQRIPSLIRLYFSDMRAALAALRASVTDNADFLLDIGDSRFAGIHVPTDELLGKIATSVGWRVLEVVPVRKRRSYDGTQLRQVVLRMKAA